MTSIDGVNWTPAPNGRGSAIIYAGGQFVSMEGFWERRVFTSPDGLIWSTHENAAPAAGFWHSLAYGNGLYVAVAWNSGGAKIITSPDGVNWSAPASANPPVIDRTWWSVAYGNGVFVVIDHHWGEVLVSSDGIDWTLHSTLPIGHARSITFGNGLFVAVGGGGATRVATSTDGATWTPQTATELNNWTSVTYGNGLFVAVAGDGANRVMTSPDGIDWTPMAAAEANDWASVAFGAGRFVAVSGNGTNRVMTTECLSPGCTGPEGPAGTMVYSNNYRVLQWCDGANWQALGPINPPGPNNGCVDPAKPGGNLLFSQTYCVLQYCDGDTWRGIGKIDPCACDPDAGTWTAQVMPESQLWRGLVFGNGMFVAAGSNPASSPDGINWTVHNTVDLANGAGGHIAFGNGLFVAPSQGGWIRQVSTSSDGVNWTMHDPALPPSWPPADAVGDIVYGDNQFVIVGGGGGIATSPDGIAWTPRTSGVTTGFTSVTYGNGLYVASGQWSGATPDYPVVISPDGINWTPVPAANVFNAKVTRIDFGNGLFVGKTYQGGPQLIYSTDGVNWTAGDPGNVYSSWSTISTIYANGRFVTAGNTGGPTTLYSSEDGITWSVLESPTLHGVGGIAYGNGVFVTVNDGTGAMRATCVGGG
ncbi:WD40/YVTN/BNR-like repeat-containing protein [Hyphomicrobium sp.]|uniref:WD40/YVTN/BNR-like repeat-containing protein n=1 Tax=Hyphomicrobium sp. TaxID=82 RepID=UPI002FE25394